MRFDPIVLAIGVLVIASACSAKSELQESALVPDAGAIEAHMAYLASDELEGREAGTPGYDKAADYVAGEFARLGLAPAGDDGTYFQTVRLKRGVRVPEAGTMRALDADGNDLGLEVNVDYAVTRSVSLESSAVEASVVFVGYGLVAEEAGRNDYDGLDVEGKIVAMLSRTPSGFDSEERAFYGSRKGREASERGAVGVLSLETPTSNRIYSFARLVGEGRLEAAGMSWIDPDETTYSSAPNVVVGASVSLAGAAKLFADAPVGWDEITAAAEAEGGVTATFELPLTVRLAQQSRLDEVVSSNVVGLIEGADPDLKHEIIVLSAHLDHLGISKTFEEDRINNGAIDNAAGIATLLDTARMIQSGPAPRRSIMFLAVTGEEKGLLGAQYFAKHPTVERDRLVANVNLDMPVLTYAFTDLVVFGGLRSTITEAIEQAAEEMELVVSPDPFPEQSIFTRSDHFRFVEEGIPSVMLATGFANGGEQAWAEHFATTYHRPGDDMNNNLDFEAAARFAEVNTRMALELANRDERPLWKKDDFFARQFDGPMQAE